MIVRIYQLCYTCYSSSTTTVDVSSLCSRIDDCEGPLQSYRKVCNSCCPSSIKVAEFFQHASILSFSNKVSRRNSDDFYNSTAVIFSCHTQLNVYSVKKSRVLTNIDEFQHDLVLWIGFYAN